ncbi:MAG: DUF6261 family protein [Candidatus Saccharimonadaceae bacterium]
MMHLDDNPNEMAAFDALGLKTYLKKLEKANIECENAHMERVRQKAKRPQVNKRIIADEALHMLRIFFDQLEYLLLVYKEVNYTPLISKLNVLMGTYSNIINTRITVNKKKANKKAEVENCASVPIESKVQKKSEKKSVTKSKSITSKGKKQVQKKENRILPPIFEKNTDDAPILNVMNILKSPNRNEVKDRT